MMATLLLILLTLLGYYLPFICFMSLHCYFIYYIYFYYFIKNKLIEIRNFKATINKNKPVNLGLINFLSPIVLKILSLRGLDFPLSFFTFGFFDQIICINACISLIILLYFHLNRFFLIFSSIKDETNKMHKSKIVGFYQYLSLYLNILKNFRLMGLLFILFFLPISTFESIICFFHSLGVFEFIPQVVLNYFKDYFYIIELVIFIIFSISSIFLFLRLPYIEIFLCFKNILRIFFSFLLNPFTLIQKIINVLKRSRFLNKTLPMMGVSGGIYIEKEGQKEKEFLDKNRALWSYKQYPKYYGPDFNYDKNLDEKFYGNSYYLEKRARSLFMSSDSFAE